MPWKTEIVDNPERPFPYTPEQLDEMYGDPGESRRRLKDFGCNADVVYSKATAEAHPNRWVAVQGGKIVVTVETYDALLDELDKLEIRHAPGLATGFTGPEPLAVSARRRA